MQRSLGLVIDSLTIDECAAGFQLVDDTLVISRIFCDKCLWHGQNRRGGIKHLFPPDVGMAVEETRPTLKFLNTYISIDGHGINIHPYFPNYDYATFCSDTVSRSCFAPSSNPRACRCSLDFVFVEFMPIVWRLAVFAAALAGHGAQAHCVAARGFHGRPGPFFGIGISMGLSSGFGIGCIYELIHLPTFIVLYHARVVLLLPNYNHFWDEDPASSAQNEPLWTLIPKCWLWSFVSAVRLKNKSLPVAARASSALQAASSTRSSSLSSHTPNASIPTSVPSFVRLEGFFDTHPASLTSSLVRFVAKPSNIRTSFTFTMVRFIMPTFLPTRTTRLTPNLDSKLRLKVIGAYGLNENEETRTEAEDTPDHDDWLVAFRARLNSEIAKKYGVDARPTRKLADKLLDTIAAINTT